MNNKLTIVGIEVPDGGVCQGTKVKLSNGQYLTGIQSIILKADTDTKLWQLSLEVNPRFLDQQTIEALLVSIEFAKCEERKGFKESILQQISELQARYEEWEECSGCSCHLVLEQNNQLIQLISQSHQLISQLVQINNEQTAQINELLIRLEDEGEEPTRSRNLDD